jgi:putative Holliday junction resolvase
VKYISFDVGEKRIGVAVSDDSGIITRPIGFLEVSHDLITKMGVYFTEEKPQKAIFGLPRHQDGRESELVSQIKIFAEVVKNEFNVEVDFEDESGTSIEAERRIKERGISPLDFKKYVDAEAASIILESYLSRTIKKGV